jgi:hypothetical protein
VRAIYAFTPSHETSSLIFENRTNDFEWVLNDMRPRHQQLFADGVHVAIPLETEAQREAVAHAFAWADKAVQEFYNRVFSGMVDLEIELYIAKFESGPQPPKPTTRTTAKIIEFDQG